MVSEQRDRTPVLDHGYVSLVEVWGSDERIIEAARMSTDKGFQGWGDFQRCNYCGALGYHLIESPTAAAGYESRRVPCVECKGVGSTGKLGDEKLLRYLWKHKHYTPFEMSGMTIEVQCPIFVMREWHRHRTQSYNELSARYTPLPDVNYVPTVERLMMTSDKNKQAQGTGAMLTATFAEDCRKAFKVSYSNAQLLYTSLLGSGVPKELARLCIPVGRYSRMRASANLRNWLGFLTLRMDEAAQWEIRQYAQVVGTLVKQAFPRTWDVFHAE